MDDLIFTLNAIMPIIFIIALGYFLKKVNFFKGDFLKQANKLVFRVCLPILLFFNVYSIKNISEIKWSFLLYIVGAVMILFVLGCIVIKFLIPNPKQKGVVLQSFFRSNYAIIGIPLATSLAAGLSDKLHDGVIANAALASAFSIPLFNILAVIALTFFDRGEDENSEGTKKSFSIKTMLLDICKNPLILGVVAGFVVLGIRALFKELNINFSIKDDAKFIYKAIEDVSKVASPLALIVLGGQFEFKAISRLKFQIIISTVARTLVVPTVGLIGAYALGFRTLEFPALIGIFATPIAVSSVPMAAEMKQDDELAGQIVVWTTIVSAFTLFIIIMVCRSIGIF